jgi:predicted Zn-dependent protease
MKYIIAFFCSLSILLSCKDVLKTADNINLLTIEDDLKLGQQVKEEIASKPKEYPLLPEKGNEPLYGYVRGIAQKILNSGKVQHKSAFPWEIHIINDANTLNAFCTPGGYIYVYTGILKFLDSEDQLAGVLGHEMGHADKRHSTRQLTKLFGIQLLLEIALGKPKAESDISKIAQALVGLQFSRSNETEADEQSVVYMCSTLYPADGAAGFFRKMEGKGGNPPVFLSTHPNPGDRIKHMETRAIELGCTGSVKNTSQYAQMKTWIK